MIVNGMEGLAKSLDDIRTEQKVFISGLRRVEKRVEALERKMGQGVYVKLDDHIALNEETIVICMDGRFTGNPHANGFFAF